MKFENIDKFIDFINSDVLTQTDKNEKLKIIENSIEESQNEFKKWFDDDENFVKFIQRIKNKTMCMDVLTQLRNYGIFNPQLTDILNGYFNPIEANSNLFIENSDSTVIFQPENVKTLSDFIKVFNQLFKEMETQGMKVTILKKLCKIHPPVMPEQDQFINSMNEKLSFLLGQSQKNINLINQFLESEDGVKFVNENFKKADDYLELINGIDTDILDEVFQNLINEGFNKVEFERLIQIIDDAKLIYLLYFTYLNFDIDLKLSLQERNILEGNKKYQEFFEKLKGHESDDENKSTDPEIKGALSPVELSNFSNLQANEELAENPFELKIEELFSSDHTNGFIKTGLQNNPIFKDKSKTISNLNLNQLKILESILMDHPEILVNPSHLEDLLSKIRSQINQKDKADQMSANSRNNSNYLFSKKRRADEDPEQRPNKEKKF